MAPRKKNRPPAKEYQPYESGNITVLREREENDMMAINSEIEGKSKLSKLSKLRMEPPQEAIPFPPRTLHVHISM
jgi:hypothetical protein